MKIPCCAAAGALLLMAATSASAQQPGDRVRVSGSLAGSMVGVIVEADSAGLRLSSGYAPYAAMGSLEVWRGIERHPGRGFKYGLVAGGVLGTVVGMTSCTRGCNDPVPLVGAVWGGVGGLLGGVLGWLTGSAIKSDIWEPVPIPGGLSLRLAVGGT